MGKMVVAMSLSIDLQMQIATNDASALSIFVERKDHRISKNFQFIQDPVMKD